MVLILLFNQFRCLTPLIKVNQENNPKANTFRGRSFRSLFVFPSEHLESRVLRNIADAKILRLRTYVLRSE